jgi:hypothetical protein
MYGVLPVILIEEINIMLVLLMISANSLRYICLDTNLKSSKNSKNSKA